MCTVLFVHTHSKRKSEQEARRARSLGSIVVRARSGALWSGSRRTQRLYDGAQVPEESVQQLARAQVPPCSSFLPAFDAFESVPRDIAEKDTPLVFDCLRF